MSEYVYSKDNATRKIPQLIWSLKGDGKHVKHPCSPRGSPRLPLPLPPPLKRLFLSHFWGSNLTSFIVQGSQLEYE